MVWHDAAGGFSACLVEWSERAAIGRSVREAIEQLRDLLEWRYRQNEWLDPPDLEEPELLTFKVPIRPEYIDERSQRRYPLNELFELRVPCVIGRQSSGMRLAAMPLLGLRLNLHAHDDLKSLVTHAVQRQLEGQTPRQLSRFVPPEGVRLEDVFVSVNRRRESLRPPVELRFLTQVADPLGDPKVRSQFGRAWERDDEVVDLTARLQSDRGSVLLLGEAGCGKTTIA